MQQVEFQTKVIDGLTSINQTIVSIKHDVDALKEKMEDVMLSEDDKAAIDEALLEEKEGKLLKGEEVFKNA